MKTKHKALLLTICAALLVVATVLTTIAWLTSNDQVTNTFTYGKVEIVLDEARVNAKGEPVKTVTSGDTTTDKVVSEPREADRVNENSYTLRPGAEYTKDVIVHIKGGSENCYLFVTIDNGLANYEGDDPISEQLNRVAQDNSASAIKWIKVDGYTNVYCLSYVDENNAKEPCIGEGGAQDDECESFHVFRRITISKEANAADLEKLNNANITIKAYAVQADGFEGKTAKEIWETAFNGYGTKDTATPDPAE